AHVACAVHDAGEPAHLLDRVIGLVLERALRPLRDDQVGFDVAALERLEHADAEDGAGRAGHADDETPHSVSSVMAATAGHGSQQTHENRFRASTSMPPAHPT